MDAGTSPSASRAAGPAAAFYSASPAIGLFRFALAVVQRLSPPLAVRAAQRLFGTPFPLRMLRRPHRWGAEWRQDRWAFENGEVTVHSPSSAAHAPVALLVHGWGGDATQLLPLARTLAQHGLRPVLVDLPAHGASGGSASNLPQFARAIEYAVARLMQEGHNVHVLAAHSLGANAAAFAAARNLPIRRLVLVAPPASPRHYIGWFANVFGLSDATRRAMQKRLESGEGLLLGQFEPHAVGPRIHVPTLVVHDEEDRVNSFADGQAFVRAVRGAELMATCGLGHRRMLADAQVLGRIAIFSS